MSRKDSTDDDGMLLGESASMSSRSSSSKASLAKVAARKAALDAKQARLKEQQLVEEREEQLRLQFEQEQLALQQQREEQEAADLEQKAAERAQEEKRKAEEKRRKAAHDAEVQLRRIEHEIAMSKVQRLKTQLELEMEREQAEAEENVLRTYVEYEEQGLGIPPADLQQSYLPSEDTRAQSDTIQQLMSIEPMTDYEKNMLSNPPGQEKDKADIAGASNVYGLSDNITVRKKTQPAQDNVTAGSATEEQLPPVGHQVQDDAAMTLPATVNPPTQDTSVDKRKVDDGPQPATTSKTIGTSSAMTVDDEPKSSRHSHSMTVRTQFQDDVRSRVLKRHTARSHSPAQGPQVSNPPALPAGAQVKQRTSASVQQRSRSPAQGTQVSNPPVSQTGTQVKSRASNPAQPKMSRPTRTTSQVSSLLSVNAPPFVPQVQDQVISDGDDEAVGAQDDGTPLTSPHHPQMSSTPRNGVEVALQVQDQVQKPMYRLTHSRR